MTLVWSLLVAWCLALCGAGAGYHDSEQPRRHAVDRAEHQLQLTATATASPALLATRLGAIDPASAATDIERFLGGALTASPLVDARWRLSEQPAALAAAGAQGPGLTLLVETARGPPARTG